MTLRWLVSGMVQGVGFRNFVMQRATALDLAGWVTNLPDGRVEVVARGEMEALNRLTSWLAVGPRHAQVTNVDKTEISDEMAPANSFYMS